MKMYFVGGTYIAKARDLGATRDKTQEGCSPRSWHTGNGTPGEAATWQGNVPTWQVAVTRGRVNPSFLR
jgi:hypothetical protein